MRGASGDPPDRAMRSGWEPDATGALTISARVSGYATSTVARRSAATVQISSIGRPATSPTEAPTWIAGSNAATSWKLLAVGVVARRTSSLVRPSRSAMHAVPIVTGPDNRIAPFGEPVVPDV